MKIKKKNVIKYDDFYSDIELIRIKRNNEVEYKGTYRIGKKLFESSFTMSRISFDDNIDQIESIDSFAKKQIADDLEEQINCGAK